MNIFEQLAQSNEENQWEGIVGAESNEPIKGNIFEQLAVEEGNRKSSEFGILDYAKDVAQQVPKNLISGAAGAYGNLGQLTGADQGVRPAEEARMAREQDILGRLNQDASKVSTADLMDLSDDEIQRPPTGNEINKAIEAATGIGEGKTAPGRIAGRGASFLGEGAALGGAGMGTLAASGIAGQSLREAGAPEWAASGVEIAAPLAKSAISGKLAPTNKASKDVVDAGRKVGLSEAQITPLIQGEKKAATLSKVARKGTKTKKLFSSIKESLGDSYNNVKQSVAGYGKLDPQNSGNLYRKFTDIRNDLQKTLKASPDKEAAIKFIDDSINNLLNHGTTPEELINFWQDINKSVKWGSIDGGKKAIARLKEPILDALNKTVPEAAKDFELTNQLYSKYSEISKKLKPDIIDAVLNKGEIVSIAPAAVALATGNIAPVAALASETGMRLLAREMLINPYFQNTANKLVKNFNSGSVKSIKDSVQQVKEFMTRKYPDEKWSFLTEEISPED